MISKKKIKNFLFYTIGTIFTIWYIFWQVAWLAGPKADHIAYGVTFSAPYAQSLGLEWKKAYTAMLQDLGVKNLRLSAYWDATEPRQNKYDFSDLDFQVNQASAYNATVVLAIGRRLPRWPECHDPDWIGGMATSTLQSVQLDYLTTIVNRFKSNAHITMWQVENEPFLSTFGICPPLDKTFFSKEISMVKTLDPSRPVLVTDSGELDSWLGAGAYGDVLGSTYYRYVFSDVLKRYWTNFYFFPWVYDVKGGILRMVHPGKQILISELEAEPWTTAGIPNTPISEQMKTMSLDHFKTITGLAADTGYSPQYMWGVEWWYWMQQHGHPEFWQEAKTLINQ